MFVNIIWLLIGFAILAFGANWLITGAKNIAEHFQVSQLFIGVTLLALGTSLPECVVGTYAAYHGNPQVALGAAIGSNIANIGLVLGITAILIPLKFHLTVLKREFPLLFLAMIFLTVIMLSGALNRWDAVALLLLMIFILWRLIKSVKKHKPEKNVVHHEAKNNRLGLSWGLLILGLILLPLGSHLIISHAEVIAKRLGVSDLLIGLTIVALGTSLPELAATIAGARKQQYDLIAGNILGSNIFNLLIVLFFPILIASPLKVSNSMLYRDIPMMFFITILLYAILFFAGKKGNLSRVSGSVLLLTYIAYMIILL